MSFEAEKNCSCYKFMLCDGTYILKYEVDHDYDISVKLHYGSRVVDDILKFKKTIKMTAESKHVLSGYGTTSIGGADTEVGGLGKPVVDANAVPWAYVDGFTGGNPHNLTKEIYPGYSAALTSTWTGNLAESVSASEGSLKAVNALEDTETHIAEDYAASASSISTNPIGWANVAVDGGTKTLWVDDVGFRNHIITASRNGETVVNIRDMKFTEGQNGNPYGSYHINIIGNPFPQSSWLIGGWYHLVDGVGSVSEGVGDGHQMAMSSWMLSERGARYRFVHDVVDYILAHVSGTVPGAASSVVAKLLELFDGLWQGGVCSSRLQEDKRYLLFTDNSGTKLFEIMTDKEGNTTLTPAKSPVEDRCYSICPM